MTYDHKANEHAVISLSSLFGKLFFFSERCVVYVEVKYKTYPYILSLGKVCIQLHINVIACVTESMEPFSTYCYAALIYSVNTTHHIEKALILFSAR